MEYALLVVVILLLMVSPKTSRMLSGDSTTNAPSPRKEHDEKIID